MANHMWCSENRKMLICVDSYHSGVPIGRIYNSGAEPSAYESLSQLLIRIHEIIDEQQAPQAYTIPRTFCSTLELPESGTTPASVRKGRKATFEVRILFCQHTSWQGMITWREGSAEQSFRSVLELIILMDSALRASEASIYPPVSRS